MAAEPAAPREFSITAGGPFHRLARRLDLHSPAGGLRAWRLAGFAWLPIVVDTLVRVALGASVDAIVLDISVHARFLVSLPLLVLSERLLTGQCGSAVIQLYTGAVGERRALDRIIDSAERMRDNPWVEGTLALAAFVGGQLALWGVTGPTGVFHGIASAEVSVARIWYDGIALPLVQFLLLRWLWRWVIWTVILVRLSRLPLAATANHPDEAAGLRFLSAPVTGFAAFELAFASTLAGVWATQMIEGRVTVPSLAPSVAMFVVFALVVSCGPLVLFTPHLYRARRQALRFYNPFAFDYVRRFHRKWIEERGDEQLLGTPDIQSLADLANSYRTITGTGMFVVGKRHLVEVWLGAILPMLPLIATVVPLHEWIKRLGSTMFGGLLP